MKALRWVRSLFGVLALAQLAGCFVLPGERVWKWEEEVVLSTGERLLLERTLRFERGSAPFNPLKASWAERESTLRVIEGPDQLKSARYEHALTPLLLERDTTTGDLILIATPIFCSDFVPLRLPKEQLYAAWVLRPNTPMQLVPVPDWAWGRSRNLLLPDESAPPMRVSPEFAKRLNRPEARATPGRFFIVERHVHQTC